MKKLTIVMVLALVAATAGPSHAFLDYLFGGSHTRDAIDNSAAGDLRAWWTGNPAYQFNPYYSGSANPGQPDGRMPPGPSADYQGYGQSPGQMQPQASITYFPGQAQQQYGYGGYQHPQQPQQPAYYGQGGAPMPYQGAPQGYQQVPQQYQQAPPQYYQQPMAQQVPQQYQQQMPQQYQQAPPQYYQQPQYQQGVQQYGYQQQYQ